MKKKIEKKNLVDRQILILSYVVMFYSFLIVFVLFIIAFLLQSCKAERCCPAQSCTGRIPLRRQVIRTRCY